MSRAISSLRRHAIELVAVLLAGVGLGVGIAALAIGDGSTEQRVMASTRARSTHASGRSLPPASAGVQRGRAQAYGGSTGRRETKAPASALPVLDANARATFVALSGSLPGQVELAVAPLGAGRSEVLGGDEPAHGWSTTKVPVLVSLLRAQGSAGLTAQEQSLAQSAITESSNEAVLGLFGDLERLTDGLVGASQYMEELLQKSGDDETVVATAPPPPDAVTTFGQTEWKPSEAVKFFRALALDCLLDGDGETSYVLNLMEHVEPSESWGLGSAGFSSVAFKGGWGPESGGGYLVRQSGIVDPGSSGGVAVAIVAFAPSFDEGTEMLTRTAHWLHAHLSLSPRPKTGCSE